MRSTWPGPSAPHPSPFAATLATRSPVVVMSASTQTTTEPTAADSPSGADILAAVIACEETLTAKINYLATNVSLIHQDLDKFWSRVSEVEDRVSTVEDVVRSDSRDLRALQMQVKVLQERAIDTANRLRQNNIHTWAFLKGPRH